MSLTVYLVVTMGFAALALVTAREPARCRPHSG